MKIDYLWHSEFLVNIENNNWETVRILSDSWLSNYALWDFMERNPMIKIDYDKLPKIDAIFLSHSHCDHVDPYTLIEMYKNRHPRPLLLIPETIEFLIPLFKEFLPKQKIQLLRNKEILNLNWIDIQGIIYENNFITNEDDVMTLAISNDKELLYTDVDTVPPETEEAYETLYNVFTRKNYESMLYISTRNELEWNFKILEMDSKEKRKEFMKEHIEYRKEEIAYNYLRFNDYLEGFIDIQELPGFKKAFVGQWIIFPTVVNPDFQKIKFLQLPKEKELEQEVMNELGYNYPLTDFIPWKSYNVSNNNFELLWNIEYINDIKYTCPETDLDTELFLPKREWPLNDEKRNIKAQENIILDLLNNRFLPYRLANTQDPLKNIILNSSNNKYVIKIRYWTKENYYERNYFYDFSVFKFQEEKWKHWDYNEDYRANDIEDFYNWRQELYSNFLHNLKKWKIYRFWTFLWSNFINNDLIYKKFNFHFKRASIWRTVDSYVLPKWWIKIEK